VCELVRVRVRVRVRVGVRVRVRVRALTSVRSAGKREGGQRGQKYLPRLLIVSSEHTPERGPRAPARPAAPRAPPRSLGARRSHASSPRLAALLSSSRTCSRVSASGDTPHASRSAVCSAG